MPTRKKMAPTAAKSPFPLAGKGRRPVAAEPAPPAPKLAAAASATEEHRRPGFRLVQQINFEMARRGISKYSQVSEEMGFTDDPRALYLSRMQSGIRNWNSAGLDRLRMVADWLAMAPLEVMMLAEVVTPQDAMVEVPVPHELDRLVSRIAADPEYGKVLPYFADLTLLPPWAKVLLLLFYDEVNRFRLQRAGRQSDIPDSTLLAMARRFPK
jgi:hypothetical protein